MRTILAVAMMVAGLASMAHAGCKVNCTDTDVFFSNCTPAQVAAFRTVCDDMPQGDDGERGVEGTTTTTTITTTTITPSDDSTTTTTLENRCTPEPGKVECRHYNRLRTVGFNCDVTVNGKRGLCKKYHTRRDGFVVATGCAIVVY